MKVTIRHLGTSLTNADPTLGYYVHDYLIEDAHGRVERIRDDEFIADGEYEVDDDFFDKIPVDEDDDEW